MAVSALDLFRVGIGPSSSHTVAPMRAARVVGERLLGTPSEVIEIGLFGSLAWTGRGAVGAVSGLAAGMPELVLDAVRSGSACSTQQASRARQILNRYPFVAAVKAVLRLRGLPVAKQVRSPLRQLTPLEEDQLSRDLWPLLRPSSRPTT